MNMEMEASKERAIEYWEVLKPPRGMFGLGLPEQGVYPSVTIGLKIRNKRTREEHDFPKKVPVLIAAQSFYKKVKQRLSGLSEIFKENVEPSEIYLIAVPNEGENAFIYQYWGDVFIKTVEGTSGTYINGREVGSDPKRVDIYNGRKFEVRVGESEFEILPEYRPARKGLIS
jgi:hypothetical protein